MKYEVIGYDLIAEDYGYSVNDTYHTGLEIEINNNTTDHQIIKKLKDIGYLINTCKTTFFDIQGELEYSLYVDYNNYKGLEPVCELRPITE